MRPVARILILAVMLDALLSFAGCSKVHEFPEAGKEVDPTQVDTRITIKCLNGLSGVEVVTKSGNPVNPEEEIESKYDRRFIVEVRSAEDDEKIVMTRTLFREASDTSSLSVETKLNTRKYKLVVWMDYVLKGTGKDLYYLTGNGTDIKNIHLPGKSSYVAGTDYKDSQTYLADLDLTPYVGQWFADISVLCPLYRQMAKITFLANDIEELVKSLGYVGSLEDLSKELVVEFFYNGYFPTGFNAVTGRLNDSETGFGFNSGTIYPSVFEEKAYTRVGSDYVFVNGESSSVTVSAVIRTKAGVILNEVSNIVVPIYRGKETVVIYKFFTREYVPGIGIDPGFDGEFNVYV